VPRLEVVRAASDVLDLEVLPGAGARLHRLRAHGHDLLRTPADVATHLDDPFFWGAYVMAPWANRATPGPILLAGRTVDLSPNFGDGTAIHGLVHDRAWRRTGIGSCQVAAGGGGWPWRFEVAAEWSVSGNEVALAYRLRNVSDGPMPAGVGWHPWLVRPVRVGLDAGLVVTDNGDPAADAVPATGSWRLDVDRPTREGLDATWVRLASPAVHLRWPNLGIRAVFEVRAPRPSVAVATPTSLDATAVEPQTHAPWGLRRLAAGDPDGLALLGPGEVLGLELRGRFLEG
jgi:aldose 1-epimerase